jgi:hypothetical protein
MPFAPSLTTISAIKRRTAAIKSSDPDRAPLP